MFILCPKVMNKLIIQMFYWFISILGFFGLLSGCTSRKDISKEAPYNQCVGRKFILKEDIYIFKYYDSLEYSIAGPNSGINGLTKFVDEKYIGRDNGLLVIKGVIKKNTLFSIVKIIDVKEFESSYVRFFVSFNSGLYTNENINCNSILNWKFYPFTKTWGDPPIFEADLVKPLPSDGVWWK